MANFNDMDELELPSLDGLDYSDAPDAYEEQDASFDANEDNEPVVEDMDYSLDDISVPVFSEMDGSAAAVPEAKPAQTAPTAPSSTVPQQSAMPQFEDMSAPVKPLNLSKPASAQTSSYSQSAAPSSSTYQNTSSSYQNTSGSYQSSSGSAYQGTSSRSSSMDELYGNRIDSEKYERGKKKTRIISGIAIATYGYNTLSCLISLLSVFSLSTLLDLAVAGVTLYLFIRLFKGSNEVQTILSYFLGFDILKNIGGLIMAGAVGVAVSSIGLSGLVGFIAFLGAVSLVIRCVAFYFIAIDSDVSEYNKYK